ncbi:MAG: double-strand break repair helicase AddA [Pseudomonadota bacterium]
MSERAKLPMTVFEETVAHQRAAASPTTSAFVSANAGSGKTRVLTNRVARLLLEGAPPDKILCITYTKAAAAEMANRLFTMLGKWALADDDALRDALKELEGESYRHDRSDDDLRKARRLFARALETPGGLKIQTIHSFCENLLRRFPLEADTPPGFTVIEDTDARALFENAMSKIAAKAHRNEDLANCFALLSDGRAPGGLHDLIFQASLQLKDTVVTETPGALRVPIEKALGCDFNLSEHDLIENTMKLISIEDLKTLAEALSQGGKRAIGWSETLANAAALTEAEARYKALKSVFLKTDNSPRTLTQIYDKKVLEHSPGAEPRTARLSACISETAEELKSLQLGAQTLALQTLAHGVRGEYIREKIYRGVLDFDDLIYLAERLLSTPGRTDWVMYKLDQGIDHILLDEAQDTSPGAWQVIERPLREFIAGSGARIGQRTFFAVGDQKQSIYSFQGADSELFQEKRLSLGKDLSTTIPYTEVPLQLSFRTTRPILEFVDAAFEDNDVLDGVSAERPLTHKLFREGEAGRVELWPLAPIPDTAELAPWDAPFDVITRESAISKLTNKVADQIAEWLSDGELLEAKGRPVEPRDIMILLQARTPLFHEMIKALGRRSVPVAGADKIKLLEDQAVLDLLSYARTVLYLEDDLSLAETLKSPFFAWDEAQLFELAYGRKASLWSALRERSDEASMHAVVEIETAARIAQHEGPAAFFYHLLETGKPAGRKRLLGRLGGPAREPLDEFLRIAIDFENGHARSLRGFVQWAEANAGEVSRNPDPAENVVQVMTVHKSKGLEAPIVFLLDAHRRHVPKQPYLSHDIGGATVNFLNPSADKSPARLSASREKAARLQSNEYRRLFYVAATRAEDRLYVCGLASKKLDKRHDTPPSEKCWYALAEDAFDRLGDDTEIATTLWDQPVRCYAQRQETPVDSKTGAGAPHPTFPDLPAFFRTPNTRGSPQSSLAPSRLADRLEADETGVSAYSPRNGALYRRGQTIHKLLEVLPKIGSGEREARASDLIDRLVPGASEEEHAQWRAEALSILEDPQFRDVFGPNSRAEVSIAGTVSTPSGPQQVHGEIDRLAVGEREILLVDFKTNRPPPKSPEATPQAYLAQLGAYALLLGEIYPEHTIRPALIWTYEARLMPLPVDLIIKAFNRTVA